MGFEPITRGSRGGTAGTEPDKVYLAVYGRKESGEPNSVAIRIGKNVAEQLGWTVGTKIIILEGSEREAGLLKLRVDDDGYKANATNPKKPNGAIVIMPQAGHFRHHDFPTLQLGEPVQVQAFGGEMLILLPDWVVRKKQEESAN